MFGADVFVAEALGFVVGQLHDLPGFVGEGFVHHEPWFKAIVLAKGLPYAVELTRSMIGGKQASHGRKDRL
jgi:hypothetical protein